MRPPFFELSRGIHSSLFSSVNKNPFEKKKKLVKKRVDWIEYEIRCTLIFFMAGVTREASCVDFHCPVKKNPLHNSFSISGNEAVLVLVPKHNSSP